MMPESEPQPPSPFANEVAQRFESLVKLGDIQSRIAGNVFPDRHRNSFLARLHEAMQERSAINDAALSYSDLYLASRAEERSNHAFRLNTDLSEIADRIDQRLTYHAGSHNSLFTRRLNILKTVTDNANAPAHELAFRLNPRPLRYGHLIRGRELGLVTPTRFANSEGFKPFDVQSADMLRTDVVELRQRLSEHMLNSQTTGSAFRERETDEDLRSPRYGNRMAQAKQDLLAELRIPPADPAHKLADMRHYVPQHILEEPERLDDPHAKRPKLDDRTRDGLGL